MDPTDGLLKAGAAGVQLTWMDAKVGDWVVTPRIGKPVEINALWYNALRIMSVFAKRLAKPDSFAAPAEAAKRGFQRFVRADGEGLYDVIDGPAGIDASIRPNQIFAVSLPHSPLSADDQARVVRVCRRHLLTPCGLRSLAPGSPAYHPHYGGGVRERDGGYHQGPVWGWLARSVQPRSISRHRRRSGGAGLAGADVRRVGGPSVGTIGEIFDGDPPHHPRGAPAQAWSVACTLDAWRLLRAGQADLDRTQHAGGKPTMLQAIGVERQRLDESRTGAQNWRRVGPVSERAAMGHRARGLQPLRYGLGLSHP